MNEKLLTGILSQFKQTNKQTKHNKTNKQPFIVSEVFICTLKFNRVIELEFIIVSRQGILDIALMFNSYVRYSLLVN